MDFRNTIIIMTSNIGTAEFSRSGIGFRAGQKTTEEEQHRRVVMDALKNHFTPEFLNRVDEYIVFHQLGREDLHRIINIMVDKVRQRLSERSISIELTERAKDWLVEEGFDPVYGARPLRRAVERHIENVVAKRILAGEYEGRGCHPRGCRGERPDVHAGNARVGVRVRVGLWARLSRDAHGLP